MSHDTPLPDDHDLEGPLDPDAALLEAHLLGETEQLDETERREQEARVSELLTDRATRENYELLERTVETLREATRVPSAKETLEPARRSALVAAAQGAGDSGDKVLALKTPAGETFRVLPLLLAVAAAALLCVIVWPYLDGDRDGEFVAAVEPSTSATSLADAALANRERADSGRREFAKSASTLEGFGNGTRGSGAAGVAGLAGAEPGARASSEESLPEGAALEMDTRLKYVQDATTGGAQAERAVPLATDASRSEFVGGSKDDGAAIATDPGRALGPGAKSKLGRGEALARAGGGADAADELRELALSAQDSSQVQLGARELATIDSLVLGGSTTSRDLTFGDATQPDEIVVVHGGAAGAYGERLAKGELPPPPGESNAIDTPFTYAQAKPRGGLQAPRQRSAAPPVDSINESLAYGRVAEIARKAEAARLEPQATYNRTPQAGGQQGQAQQPGGGGEADSEGAAESRILGEAKRLSARDPSDGITIEQSVAERATTSPEGPVTDPFERPSPATKPAYAPAKAPAPRPEAAEGELGKVSTRTPAPDLQPSPAGTTRSSLASKEKAAQFRRTEEQEALDRGERTRESRSQETRAKGLAKVMDREGREKKDSPLPEVAALEEESAEASGKEAKPSDPPEAASTSPARESALAEDPSSGASDPTKPAEKPGSEPPTVVATPEDDGARAAAEAKRRVRVAIDDLLTRLDRQPGETPDSMFFRYWGDNPFVDPRRDDRSTIAIDVDTASYTLLRNYIFSRRVLPPAEAIRTEEFVNYFPAGLEPPKEGRSFALSSELSPSPFAHEPGYRLLRVGMKAREVSRANRKSYALTFVVDTSGSMRRENRLELVKKAMQLLVPELDEGDVIGIVAFDRQSRRILDPTPVADKESILSAIAALQSNSNTNLSAGMEMGYAMAAEAFIPGATNRVILLSDGVANTGTTEANAILKKIEAERKKGIFLTTIGCGMGNHNDHLMEQLADKGDGQCFYVDRLEEARRVFVEDLTGTLQTVAKDVKLQVVFDSAKVLRYRLLGYENRAVADHDFRNDQVDAGEVGAGHEVIALYEIRTRSEASGEFAKIHLRYKEVDHGEEVVELEQPVACEDLTPRFEDASPHLRLNACAAEFAEVLRDSYWARGSDLYDVARRVEDLLGPGEGRLGSEGTAYENSVELAALMKAAAPLVKARSEQHDERSLVVDAIKENRFLQAQLEDAERIQTVRAERRAEDERHLDQLRQQNLELRRRLESLLDR